MSIKTATQRGFSLAVAASCCMALGAWSASASEAGVLSVKPPAAATKSALQCYATRGSPDAITCYQNSWKAEFRHGNMVYIPRLIQVPTPPQPPPVIVVNSLSDIRPGGTTPG